MLRVLIKLNVFAFVFSFSVSASYSQSFENDFFAVSMGNTAAAGSYAELDTAFSMLTELGCCCTKWNFNWGVIEPLPGQYNWEQTDSISALAQQYGVSIIAFIPQIGTPPWARKPGSTAGVPEDPEEFACFIYQILNRYKDSMSIEYVEILNEISNGTSNGVNPPFGAHWDTTAVYAAEVTTAVYNTVHAHFPEVKVSSASFTQPHGLSGSMTAEDTVKSAFMNAYLTAYPQFDYLALHDYPHYGPTQTGDFEYATQYNFSDLYRELLNSYGYSDKPILVTEGSLGTGQGVSDELYAAFLAQNCIIYYSRKDSTDLVGAVKASLANALGGTTGFNIADVTTGERYMAFYAFETLKGILEQYPEFNGCITGQPDDLNYWVLKFNNEDNNSLFVSFAPVHIFYPNPELPTPRVFQYTEPQSLILDVGLNVQALVTQLYGDTSTVYSDDEGCIAFDVYNEAVFIEVQSAGTSIEDTGEIPVGTRLNQNCPNPFNSMTAISFTTGDCLCNTELVIYNISGRIVKTLVNSVIPEGEHTVSWNGTDENGQPVGSGVYFCHLRAGNNSHESRQMLLLE